MSANFYSGESSIIHLQKNQLSPSGSQSVSGQSLPSGAIPAFGEGEDMLASLSQTLGTLRAELRARNDKLSQLEIELAAAKSHQQATLTELHSRLKEANERGRVQSTQLTQDLMAVQIRLKEREEQIAKLSAVSIKLEERERQAQSLYREVQRLQSKLKDDEVKQWEETERSRSRELALEAVKAQLAQESEDRARAVLALSSRDAELERVREQLRLVEQSTHRKMQDYKESVDRQFAYERGRYREAVYRQIYQQFSGHFGKLKNEYVSLGTRYQQLLGTFQERSKRLERLESMVSHLVRSAHERMIRLRAKARQTRVIMEFFRQMGPERAKAALPNLKVHETRAPRD